MRGDVSGDLVVTVQIAEDERFERQGDDLYAVTSVDAIDAMLGTTVHIDGILAGEHIDVEIPAGCQYGQQVVVDAKGMPRLGSVGRGRLVVVANVTVPADLSQQDMAALRDIRDRRAGVGGSDEARPGGEQAATPDRESPNAGKDKAKRRRGPFRGKRR